MKDIIIIGGGLIGMLTARALHDAGANILLLEQGSLGQESSWAGGGIISPLYAWRYADAISGLTAYGQRHYQKTCASLYNETGINPEWTRSGLLILDDDEEKEAKAWAKRFSMDLQHFQTQSDVKDCEAALDNQFARGLWMPEVAQLRNPRLVKALKKSLQVRGIRYLEHSRVTGFNLQNNHVAGVVTTKGGFSASQVVVTGGAWSAQLVRLATGPIAIQPVRGQMVLYKPQPNLLQRIVLYKGRYLIPRNDGRILVGSTLEIDGFNKLLSDETKNELHAAGCNMVPALADAEIEHHWCGLRPASPNGVPYIGEHPDIKGLFVNAGHYRYGIAMGLGSAQLLLDILQNKSSFVDADDYSLTAKREPTAEFLVK